MTLGSRNEAEVIVNNHAAKVGSIPRLLKPDGDWMELEEFIEIVKGEERARVLEEVHGEVSKTLGRAVADYSKSLEKLRKVERWARDQIARSANPRVESTIEIRATAAREIRRLTSEEL